LGSFVKDQLAIDVWVYVWVFYSDLLVLLFLSQYHADFSVMVVQYSLKLGMATPPALNFLLRIALAIQSLLVSTCISRLIFLFLCRMPSEF
jgi:hypothetical protein